MTRGKATVRISALLDIHDKHEEHAPDTDLLHAERVMVETVLFDTGNYRGFRELPNDRRQYIRNDRTRTR